MEPEKNSFYMMAAKTAKNLTWLSCLIIIITVFGLMLKLEYFKAMCPCTTNNLAYAWIGFGVTVIAGLKIMFLTLNSSSMECCKCFFMKKWFINTLLIVQMLCFTIGLVYLILFAGKLSNVL
jgi:hypothetical protein